MFQDECEEISFFEGLRFRKISSPIHDLDPRVKFIFVMAIFILAVIFWELPALIILFILQIPFIFLARVSKQWLRSMRGAAFLAALIFITNFVFRFFYGSESLAYLLEQATAMTFRFIVLISSFSIFFLTTSPDMLGLALEQSRFPYDFCFAFTTAVRFVPVMADEAQTIMDAQKARGLELEKGNFLRRVRNYIPILVPLIVNAIRRSIELAEAMESRAWGATKKRTSLYVLKLKRNDYLLILLTAAIFAVAIYIKLYVPIPSISQLLGFNFEKFYLTKMQFISGSETVGVKVKGYS
ncbi:MAG TPA: energy-coupling factor transporter transmembrane protein EcfT [Candidatus Bathyarchaeota archaeon]|nr:energy-coupling factor transporter transmembrane protein EcfT [Candidatus Bathyarchaeota archaeon]HEX69247.1 energy-coupling factor transporter transmembrane protein EcfT [Candidatus Bathyarchaeota archaeon]